MYLYLLAICSSLRRTFSDLWAFRYFFFFSGKPIGGGSTSFRKICGSIRASDHRVARAMATGSPFHLVIESSMSFNFIGTFT